MTAPARRDVEVAVIRTGSANLASVSAALTRLGLIPRSTDDPSLVVHAPLAILPGVGAFGAAMSYLRDRELDEAVRRRVSRNKPLLAICLGLQLLCEASEESANVAGLGIAPGVVRRFGKALRVPQMGWNRVTPARDTRLLRESWMYFANSYRLESIPPGWSGAMTDYGPLPAPTAFASALERGTLLACQFHPELSGQAGSDLIARWLNASLTSEVAPC